MIYSTCCDLHPPGRAVPLAVADHAPPKAAPSPAPAASPGVPASGS